MICVNCYQEVDEYESGNTCFHCMQPTYQRRAMFAIKVFAEDPRIQQIKDERNNLSITG